MDLSKVPTEDLKAIQEKRWGDVSTQGLQEYQAQRQHFMQASQQAQNPQTVPDAADKAAQGGNPQAKPLSIMDPHMGSKLMSNMGLSGKAIQQSQDVENQLSGQGVSQLATTLVPGSQAALSGSLGRLGRIGLSGAAGGAEAVGVGDPNASVLDKLSEFLKGGILGSSMQTGGEAVSSAGNALSDMFMKKAVGIRKAPEGIGTNLARQGVWGTKSGMLGQVEDKLEGQESKLQDLVSTLNGKVDPKEIADAISQKGSKFVSPSGITLNSVQPDLDKVRSASEQFSGRLEGLTPQDLLSLKRQGDWTGYTASGNPAAATDSEIGRAVADKSRSLLSGLSGGETSDTLKKEQALIYAKKALGRDPTTHMGIGSSLVFGKVPGQDLLGSLAGQASQKLGDSLGGSLQDPRLQRAAEQGLFGK